MEVEDAGAVDLAVVQVRRRQNKADGEAIRKLYAEPTPSSLGCFALDCSVGLAASLYTRSL
jgi:hypothetical protein